MRVVTELGKECYVYPKRTTTAKEAMIHASIDSGRRTSSLRVSSGNYTLNNITLCNNGDYWIVSQPITP